MDINIDRSITTNAKYIIKYFNDREKEVTNLKLEKLLYFLEAIYMVIKNEDYLFDEEFTAWDFGPVCSVIYREYKEYGSFPIDTPPNIEINPENRKYIDHLYECVGDLDAFQLVNLSHSKGSPWDRINTKYEGEIPNNIIISKKETKEWFLGIIDYDDKAES